MKPNANFHASATRYLITIPNMNKITPFFSDISQQTHKVYEKVAINFPIWYRAICYGTSMSNTWYMITVSNMNKLPSFFSEI